LEYAEVRAAKRPRVRYAGFIFRVFSYVSSSGGVRLCQRAPGERVKRPRVNSGWASRHSCSRRECRYSEKHRSESWTADKQKE
jgi:hypothetical protein